MSGVSLVGPQHAFGPAIHIENQQELDALFERAFRCLCDEGASEPALQILREVQPVASRDDLLARLVDWLLDEGAQVEAHYDIARELTVAMSQPLCWTPYLSKIAHQQADASWAAKSDDTDSLA